MEFIGEHLKNVRVKKNYKLSYISKELNVSNEVLRLIEEDNFPDYLNSVFLIGHIRSYAKFLQLNEEEIIKNYKIQTSYNKNDNIKEITNPIKSDFLFACLYSVCRSISLSKNTLGSNVRSFRSEITL